MAIIFLAVTALMTIGIAGIDEDLFLGMAMFGIFAAVFSKTIKDMPNYLSWLGLIIFSCGIAGMTKNLYVAPTCFGGISILLMTIDKFNKGEVKKSNLHFLTIIASGSVLSLFMAFREFVLVKLGMEGDFNVFIWFMFFFSSIIFIIVSVAGKFEKIVSGDN